MLRVVYIIGLSALARVWPSLALPRMAAALCDPNEDVSTSAYMLLVKLGPSTGGALLEEAKSLEQAGRGREAACILEILGDHGDPERLRDLQPFLESQDPEVVEAAAGSIECLRSGSAF